MKHMGQDERNRIEFSLGCKMSVADIAKALGRSESTISRELLNRRIDSDKHYGCSNRLCARFDECQRMIFNVFKEIRRKNTLDALNPVLTSERPSARSLIVRHSCAMNANKNTIAPLRSATISLPEHKQTTKAFLSIAVAVFTPTKKPCEKRTKCFPLLQGKINLSMRLSHTIQNSSASTQEAQSTAGSKMDSSVQRSTTCLLQERTASHAKGSLSRAKNLTHTTGVNVSSN